MGANVTSCLSAMRRGLIIILMGESDKGQVDRTSQIHHLVIAITPNAYGNGQRVVTEINPAASKAGK